MAKAKKLGKPKKRTDLPSQLRRRKFALAVAGGASLSDAARAAGVKGRSVNVRASELAARPDVQEMVQAATKEAIDYLKMDVNVYLAELHAIAMQRVTDFIDEKGNWKPLKDIPANALPALASVETIMKNATAGDGVIDRVLRLRLHDKNEALLAMLKAHGVMVSKVERGKPGDFTRMSREDAMKRLEEMAPKVGLKLVKSGT